MGRDSTLPVVGALLDFSSGGAFSHTLPASRWDRQMVYNLVL